MFLGCPVRPIVLSTGQILLPRYLVNGLKKFDKNDGEYSLAPTDDLIGFWWSKMKGEDHIRPSRSNVVNTISHELLEQFR